MLKSMVNILSKRRKLLATLQSDLHEKFASYRRNPFSNRKGNPEGSWDLLLLVVYIWIYIRKIGYRKKIKNN